MTVDFYEFRELAVTLIRQHLERDWKIALNRNKRSMGVCKYRDKKIEFSQHMITTATTEEAQQIILHEIAHALVGEGHGHDDVWRRKCLSIGGNGERMTSRDFSKRLEQNTTFKYSLVCSHCGYEGHRSRQPKRKAACSDCCHKHNNGRFSEEYVLKIRRNY